MISHKVSKDLSSLISSMVFAARNLVGRLWNPRPSPPMQEIRSKVLSILRVQSRFIRKRITSKLVKIFHFSHLIIKKKTFIIKLSYAFIHTLNLKSLVSPLGLKCTTHSCDQVWFQHATSIYWIQFDPTLARKFCWVVTQSKRNGPARTDHLASTPCIHHIVQTQAWCLVSNYSTHPWSAQYPVCCQRMETFERY